MLLAMKHAFGRNVRAIWMTYRSWLVIAPILLTVVFLGRVTTIVLFTLLALVAFLEFARAVWLTRDRWITTAAGSGVIVAGVIALTSVGFLWFMMMPVFATAAI